MINPTTAKLTFAPDNSSDKITAFNLSYGYQGYPYSFGTQIAGDKREVVVESLTANASFKFKLLASNDCAPSAWSNEITLTLVSPPTAKVISQAHQAQQKTAASTPSPTSTSTPTPTPSPTSTPTSALVSQALSSPSPTTSIASFNFSFSWWYLLFFLLPLIYIFLLYFGSTIADDHTLLANITITAEKDGIAYATRTSNRFGFFTNFHLPAGDYQLTINHPAYHFANHTYTLHSTGKWWPLIAHLQVMRDEAGEG